MRKVLISVLSLILVGSLVLASVAKVPLVLAEQGAEVKPVEIEVVSIATPEMRPDYIPLTITFKVKNPNSIEVTLDRVEYNLFFKNFAMASTFMENDVYIPPESEVIFSTYNSVELMLSCIGNVIVTPAKSLGDGVIEGIAMWKEMGGVPEGLAMILNAALPILIPVIVGDALAKLGIPEAISKPVMMMVVMPLLAGIIPKLAVIVSAIVWATAEEVNPPPTYELKGTITMIAGGEAKRIDFSQSCEAIVPTPPPPYTLLLKTGGLLK